MQRTRIRVPALAARAHCQHKSGIAWDGCHGFPAMPAAWNVIDAVCSVFNARRYAVPGIAECIDRFAARFGRRRLPLIAKFTPCLRFRMAEVPFAQSATRGRMARGRSTLGSAASRQARDTR